MAYGRAKATEDSLVLVVDLGGGTYDVSLVECFEGKLRPSSDLYCNAYTSS